jgi:hypothetical protein
MNHHDSPLHTRLSMSCPVPRLALFGYKCRTPGEAWEKTLNFVLDSTMSRFFRAAGDSDSDSSSESEDELMSGSDSDAPPAKTQASTAAKGNMSRFLRTAGGSDDSDSDSSDDDDESDDDDSDDDGPKPAGKKRFTFTKDSDDSESDDEPKAGIRILSAQEKRLLEMEATGKAMDNAQKINDWVAISNGKLSSSLIAPFSFLD